MAASCYARSPTHGHDHASVDSVLDDATLARQIAAGDPAAETELCVRLLPRVRAWGLKHARDEAAALDVAQQVLVVVIEALRAGRVVEPERLSAFVFGTCKHVLVASQRGERRRTDLLARYGDVLAGISELREDAIDRRRLASCFDKLAARARTVLALSFFAERSSEEIADELGVSPGNVRVLRHRALEALHACMEGS
jgi:RNA polymerase sigma-70 factor (ECF subfamily)